MKMPHASSIVACIDGYQMTLKGKTWLALFHRQHPASSARWPSCWSAKAHARPVRAMTSCALMMFGFLCVSFVTTGSLLNGCRA